MLKIIVLMMMFSSPTKASYLVVVDTGHNENPPINLSPHMTTDLNCDDSDATEDHSKYRGHGSHTLGIAAKTCPDCSVGMVKFFGKCSSSKNVGHAIIWAIEHGADVVSYSGGGSTEPDCNSPPKNYAKLCEAIELASSLGVILVAASGNNDGTNDGIDFPAVHHDVVSAGGVDYDGNPFDFCESGGAECAGNIGPELDFVAPAFMVLSDMFDGYDWNNTLDHPCSDSSYPAKSGYGFCTGTSMAAPYVAAVLADALNYDPQMEMDDIFDFVAEHDWEPELGYGVPKIEIDDSPKCTRSGNIMSCRHNQSYLVQKTPLFTAVNGSEEFYSTSPNQIRSYVDLHGYMQVNDDIEVYTKQPGDGFVKLVSMRMGLKMVMVLEREMSFFEAAGYSFHGFEGYVLSKYFKERNNTRPLFRSFDYSLSLVNSPGSTLLGFIPKKINYKNIE